MVRSSAIPASDLVKSEETATSGKSPPLDGASTNEKQQKARQGNRKRIRAEGNAQAGSSIVVTARPGLVMRSHTSYLTFATYVAICETSAPSDDVPAQPSTS